MNVTVGDPRLPARFWAKVRVSENGCWEWMGARAKGYAHFSVGSRIDGSYRSIRGHRLAYETMIGPIPPLLEPDHLCRNRACVQPEHIELVTMRENILRGNGPSALNARKTHCLRGHPFDEINTCSLRTGKRECRACRRLRQTKGPQRSKPLGRKGGLKAAPPVTEGSSTLPSDLGRRVAGVVDVWFNKSGGKTWLIRARNGDTVIVHGG